MNIEILFENENIVAVNKPSGLMVHSDGRTDQKVLTDWVVENYPEIAGVGEPMVLRTKPQVVSKKSQDQKNPKDFSGSLETDNSRLETIIDRPGIVHRLDKDTSGVMLIAKNQEAHAYLKKQFQERTIQKTYICAVWGNIKEEEGIIDAPIGKSRGDFRQWQAGDKARGTLREAQTNFRVLKRIKEKEEHFCIVEVQPKTGRTHQIRVHMKYTHHPLVCDPLYAAKRPCVLGFNRLALHAQKIVFSDLSGDTVEVQAPNPEEFEKMLVK